MASCDICGNAGVVERDGKLYECECAELRRIAAAMPAYVRSADVKEKHIRTCLPDKKTRLIDAIDRSLFIEAEWNDMRAFIKLVMIKYRKKYLRITSDRELRDVFVGYTSKANRGENSKEAVYNSIEDLVDAPDLLLFRLNEIGYKNKALPGIFEEAVSYRLDRNKPVWLLSNASNKFRSGSFAWSDSVGALIESMTRISVDPILDNTDVRMARAAVAEASTLEAEPVGSTTSPIVKPKREAVASPTVKPKTVRSAPDDDGSAGLSIHQMGSGVKPSRKF